MFMALARFILDFSLFCKILKLFHCPFLKSYEGVIIILDLGKFLTSGFSIFLTNTIR